MLPAETVRCVADDVRSAIHFWPFVCGALTSSAVDLGTCRTVKVDWIASSSRIHLPRQLEEGQKEAETRAHSTGMERTAQVALYFHELLISI